MHDEYDDACALTCAEWKLSIAMLRNCMVPQIGLMGTQALSGLQALLNYTAGAMIYVRREYSDRINILRASWIAAPCTVQVTVRWRFIPERELPLFAIVWVCFCFCSAA